MYKILLVDDQPQYIEQVLQALHPRAQDYQLLFANNGQRALDLLKELAVDLILLDWDMPVLNGLETLKVLKSTEGLMDIPVIMHTGVHTASKDLQQAFELGAMDFLRKPVDATELLARLENVLSRQAYMQETIRLESEKAALSLELKQKELLHYAIWLEEKNGFLKNFERELSAFLQEQAHAEVRKRGQLLLRQLQQEIQAKSQWEGLRNKVNKTYEDFLRQFEEKHPQLSIGDLKLAALIRVKSPNQEIADSLHIALDSVSKKKLRLRNKLGFSSSADLEQYILDF